MKHTPIDTGDFADFLKSVIETPLEDRPIYNLFFDPTTLSILKRLGEIAVFVADFRRGMPLLDTEAVYIRHILESKKEEA